MVVGRVSTHHFCCRRHEIANGKGDSKDAHLGIRRTAEQDTGEVWRGQAGRELEERYARPMILQNVFHWLFDSLIKKYELQGSTKRALL